MGNHPEELWLQMSTLKIIDIFPMHSRIRVNMSTISAYLMEAKAKRKPTSTTSVVGSGQVSVNQGMSKDLL